MKRLWRGSFLSKAAGCRSVALLSMGFFTRIFQGSPHLTWTLFAVFINPGMAVLKEQLWMAASVYNPYCFCVMRHVTATALLIIFFRSRIYWLGTFCSFLFNISGFVCQNVLLLFRLIVIFVSISTDNTIQLRYLFPIELLYNFLWFHLSSTAQRI